MIPICGNHGFFRASRIYSLWREIPGTRLKSLKLYNYQFHNFNTVSLQMFPFLTKREEVGASFPFDLPIPGIIRAARKSKQATWFEVVTTAIGIPSAMG